MVMLQGGRFRWYGTLLQQMSQQRMAQVQLSQLVLQVLEQFSLPLSQSFAAPSSNASFLSCSYPRQKACCKSPLFLLSATAFSLGFHNLYPSHSMCILVFLFNVAFLLLFSPSCTHTCNSHLFMLILPHENFPEPCIPHYLLSLHLICINSPF